MNATAFDPNAYSYRAFLSYARADRDLVDEVFKRLSKFRTPRALRRGSGDYGAPPLSLNLFLDRKSAQLGAMIPDRLQTAITQSAFLIVFCSRASKESTWVAREIEAFLQTNPPVRILPVFIRESAADPIDALLPAPMAALGDRLPIGADIVVDGGVQPVTHKLIGAMLGFPQDQIAREQERDDRRRRTTERVALTSIAGLASVAAIAGWSAYREAAKAQTSLEVSLSALDNTTPFARQLVSQGRVTTAEVEGFAGQLDRVFQSFSTNDLRDLPDIRFSLGQVLRSSAQLNAASGNAQARLDNALRGYNLLLDFAEEPGPSPQEVICDAALETAAAYGATEQYGRGIEVAQRCDAIAATELSYHDANAPEGAGLVARRVLAKEMEARLLLAQEQFSAALAALDEAQDAERLQKLASLASPEMQRELNRLTANLGVTRGAVLESLDRPAEARDAYRAALQLYLDNDLGLDANLNAQTGSARMLAQTGAVGDAQGQLGRLIDNLGVATQRDPALRAMRATLAGLLVERANLLADQPAAAGAEDPAAAARGSVVDLNRAGLIMNELLEFDPNNVGWRTQEAARQAVMGDFYFRLAETYGASAPLCASGCFAQAERAFGNALDRLQGLTATPSTVRQRAEIELRMARTLREAGNAGEAGPWLDRAEASYNALQAASEENRGMNMLRARITDERADLAAAVGQNAQAAELYRLSLAVHEEAANAEPQWIGARRDLMWTRQRLAETLAAAGDANQARAAYAAACADAAALADLPSALAQRDRTRLAASAAAAGHACGN